MEEDWYTLRKQNEYNKFIVKRKLQYTEDLLNYNWSLKRLEILIRDSNKCVNCDKNTNLHIHHLLYHHNKRAWEYDNENLITLCSNCHEWEHKDYGEPTLIRKLYWQNKIT